MKAEKGITTTKSGILETAEKKLTEIDKLKKKKGELDSIRKALVNKYRRMRAIAKNMEKESKELIDMVESLHKRAKRL